jgi:hypothetical protein
LYLRYYYRAYVELKQIANLLKFPLGSAILTMLQLTGIANDPVARHAALFSLICALMSLLYGCMYIIRFGSMKGARQAVEWVAVRSRFFVWYLLLN